MPGFTRKAIANRATSHLTPGCQVTSDGLACFVGDTHLEQLSDKLRERRVRRIIEQWLGRSRLRGAERQPLAAMRTRVEALVETLEPIPTIAARLHWSLPE